jgi:RNA-directed DNA polymerase
MMYERGKSDSAIVATKPTNNAERSAAEPVEPRAGTKGNASQQSTGRTQRRETVSQALERIRQAARQGRRNGSPRSSTTSTSIAPTGILRD